MGVANISTSLESTTARDLRAALRGRVLLRGDRDYNDTRQVWNGAVQHQPAPDGGYSLETPLSDPMPSDVSCCGGDDERSGSDGG
jgi:hypothetical protein